jgi:hypothetical protein
MTSKEFVKNIPGPAQAFAGEIRKNAPVRVESVYVVGSVLTPDFQPALSDINTLILTREQNTFFLDFLITLGQRFKEDGLAPPLVMSEEYVYRSLDTFPIEFLNFREIHHVLFGPDILNDLEIEFAPLRLQCEREIKARLLWLGQVYLETMAQVELLAPRLIDSITGYFPLMRALLVLADSRPAHAEAGLIEQVQALLGLEDDIFMRLRTMKRQQKSWLDQASLREDYSRFCQAVWTIAHYVDTLAD